MESALNTPATRRRLPDEAATERLGAEIAALARPGDTVALSGDLGAGKTVLARGFVQARLGRVDVTSPTFTLVQIYGEGPDEIWHVDLYRVEAAAELRELGLDDAFERVICLVEWPERLGEDLPEDRLEVALAFEGAERAACVTPYGSWRHRWPGP